MAKVTSKLQVTLPKAVADRYGIVPGDEIEFVPAGDGIRVLTASQRFAALDRDERLELFDAATVRQKERKPRVLKVAEDRGWTRDDLYGRGSTG